VTTSLTWLLLIYRVPAEPTRLRATVWRRVKALGAVYLQNAVVVLPDTTHHERRLRALGEEIVTLGGTAQVLRSTALAGAQDISAALNAARAEEYVEVVGRCTDFLTEIDTETAREKFTYAELEEEDEDLTKLTSWLGKIHARDTLGAPGRAAADAALARCVAALAVFADRVYTAEQVAEAARSRVAGVDPDLHPGLGRAGARRLRRRTAGSVMTAPEQQHLERASGPCRSDPDTGCRGHGDRVPAHHGYGGERPHQRNHPRDDHPQQGVGRRHGGRVRARCGLALSDLGGAQPDENSDAGRWLPEVQQGLHRRAAGGVGVLQAVIAASRASCAS